METKKLINDVEHCVDDCLQGLVAINPGLWILEGHRVVVRSDIKDMKGKVTLISGGGSGHEPTHAGFVGAGMLSAAVAGCIFTSPPPNSILAAIRTCAGRGGVLLIVKNYTGDRLNFGIAAERAKAEGLDVDMVVVGDDCALTSADKTAGRRGLAGTLFIHKIAGALAEKDCPLASIVKEANLAKQQMGTIGMCLSPCSLPGSGLMFQLKNDEVELGLGIHGEAGVQRIQQAKLTAKEAVDMMFKHMTKPDSTTALKLSNDDELALMVNNLGGTSVLELNIVAKEAIDWLETRGYHVQRAYCGSFITSLDMAGVSLTLMKLTDTRKECLDWPTTAPAWATPLLSKDNKNRCTPPKMAYSSQPAKDESVAVGGVKTSAHAMHKVLSFACEALGNCERQLNVLDTQSGDGDCGTTMKRGTDAVCSQLRETVDSSQLPVSNPHQLALALAHIAEQSMGGSSGALYSLFLSAAAGPLKISCNINGWTQALEAGINAMQKYGGAGPGDRTMLDALFPALKALSDNKGIKTDSECFGLAASAAEQGAIATANMAAHAGRASQVSAKFLTQPDPGAHAVGIWMRATFEAYKLIHP